MVTWQQAAEFCGQPVEPGLCPLTSAPNYPAIAEVQLPLSPQEEQVMGVGEPQAGCPAPEGLGQGFRWKEREEGDRKQRKGRMREGKKEMKGERGRNTETQTR